MTSSVQTVLAYDLDAAAYVADKAVMPESVRRDVVAFVERLSPGARVLEIGSGGGRDAALMEELGLHVRRTDITPGFVTLLRAQGHDATVIDPLLDDLTSPDGEYDAVWANASLLLVTRDDLPTVLARLAAVTRVGGLLRMSVKEGEGQHWSMHGAIRNPRHFTYWRAPALSDVVAAAGWADVEIPPAIRGLRRDDWLEVSAVRA